MEGNICLNSLNSETEESRTYSALLENDARAFISDNKTEFLEGPNITAKQEDTKQSKKAMRSSSVGKYEKLFLRQTNSLKEKIRTSTTEEAFKLNQDSIAKKREKDKMMAIINDCYFDNCEWTEADEFFQKIIKEFGDIDEAIEVLSDIVNHNLSNDHILEGVLQILSYFNFNEINPYGISIAIACAVNQSPVIQDLLISCFDKWNSSETIDILESLRLGEIWLCRYRNKVVEQIKRSNLIGR